MFICRHPYDDRLFSQIMRHLLSFFIAKINNITHIHIPYNDNSININFETIYDTRTLINKTCDDYDINELRRLKLLYSLPDQNLVGMNRSSKKYYNINDIFTDTHINILKNSYKLIKVNDNYSSKVINICCHIRRGDIIQYGESFASFTSLKFFNDIITKIQTIITCKCNFHVYSDSKINLDIENDDDIFYHIDDDILITINEMIKADIFIISIGSNMSHFASIHSDGILFLDKSKLTVNFNNMYNIYWSKYRKFIIDEDIFINKIKEKYT